MRGCFTVGLFRCFRWLYIREGPTLQPLRISCEIINVDSFEDFCRQRNVFGAAQSMTGMHGLLYIFERELRHRRKENKLDSVQVFR